MSAAHTGPDRRAQDRRAVPAADASGAHFQRKAAEERAALAEQQLAIVTAERNQLLMALEMIADDFQHCNSGNFGDRGAAYAETARTAIAKATGSAS